jgi:translation initiation factor IF-2
MTNTPEKKATKRSPVVVVMGHVDHGKTTLLDYIRKANVAAKEAGGITQAVGAYEITHGNGRITFIDTPGHEAFTKMRSRGAQIADIAILVVAADDGVSQQTKDAIRIIKESKNDAGKPLPYIVAINKMDLPNADPNKVKNGLAQEEIFVEGFGGDVSVQEISAKTGQGVNDLLDLIALTAEVEGLIYNPAAPAKGFVLETFMNAQTGITATVIIKDGTLHTGDEVGTASTRGKVRGLRNFLGKTEKELTPSSPAIILGFDSIPRAGEAFGVGWAMPPLVPQTEKAMPTLAESSQKRLSFVVKADVAGSLEALVDEIRKIKTPDNTTRVTILGEGVGDITDGDAKLAGSTGSFIVGFNVKQTSAAKTLISSQKIKVFSSKIIYELIKEIEEEFSGRKKQIVAGDLEILKVFEQKNNGAQIIGGKVIAGEIKNQSVVEVHRAGKEIGTGRIANLQQAKKDVASVAAGLECGMLFSSQVLIEKGDHLIARPE